MTAIEKLVNTLEVIVEQHRHKMVITCAEDCWCWEIDHALTAYNAEKELLEKTQNYHTKTIKLQSRAITEWQDKCLLLETEIKRLTDPSRVLVDLEWLKHIIASFNSARCVHGGQQWPEVEVIAWMQKHGDSDEEIKAYLTESGG